MTINVGDRISFRVMPEASAYSAIVLFIDDTVISLDPEDDGSLDIPPGRYLLVTETDTDVEYYAEVMGWEGPALRLRRMWTGKRGYFRVDDVFPVVWRKITPGARTRFSRVFAGLPLDSAGLQTPEDGVSPRLWKMLADIDIKLGLILERLHLEGEGLVDAESVPVNISASGMRFVADDAIEIGDVLEVKMLLPGFPPVGVLVHGRAVRVEELERGSYETSLHFFDLDDEVRDIIIQYTLQRQREHIRRQREQEQ